MTDGERKRRVKTSPDASEATPQKTLGELIEEAKAFEWVSFDDRRIRKRYLGLMDQIGLQTQASTREEIVGVLGNFAGTHLDLNVGVLSVVLSYVEDIESIARDGIALAVQNGHLFAGDADSHAFVRIRDAYQIRAKRERVATRNKP